MGNTASQALGKKRRERQNGREIENNIEVDICIIVYLVG
jgi:hypothetical protein